MRDQDSGNTTTITYQGGDSRGSDYRSAIIEYRHKRSDYVARLRVTYWAGGPDEGFRFKDLTEAGDAYVPGHAVKEVMKVLRDG